jgi:adenylosuccinate synthase
MLDIDHGTYPFVTSSNATAAGNCTGSGVGPTKIDKIHAIMKAYVTRVGRGPFPTELGTDDETTAEGTWDKIKPDFDKLLSEAQGKANKDNFYFQGKYMRLMGREYGTTTGRPRRTGWFDAVLAKYAVAINGLSSIIITKLDVLQGLKTIKVCTHYEIDGKKYDYFQTDQIDVSEPVYKEFPGFQEDITGAKSFEDLPKNAQDYIIELEKIVGVPISIISVGPDRDQTIIRKPDEFF